MVDKTRMTSAEFFELPETMQSTELLEGELVVSPAPVIDHQESLFAFAKLLDALIPNGKVVIAPTDVYLDEENILQPDIFWVAEDSRCHPIDSRKRFAGPPDLIIEILSRGSVRNDRVTKFHLYEKHGVPEYWLTDPLLEYVEVYRLIDGKYVLQGVYEAGESFESVALGGKTVDLKRVFGR
jgi:Uma2 family endonuclease